MKVKSLSRVPGVKQLVGSSVQRMEFNVMLYYYLESEMGVGAGGKLRREGMYACILRADSCCYTAEANTVKLQLKKLKIIFFHENNKKRIVSPSPTLSPSSSNPFLLIAMDFPVVDVLCKWNHMICGPLCLLFGIMFPRLIHAVECVNTALRIS